MGSIRVAAIAGVSTLVMACASVAEVPVVAETAPARAAAAVQAGAFPIVRTADDRFQSFQVGFSHLTGGETWKAYDKLDTNAQAKDITAVREARAATDLGNPRLIKLARALSPFYVRYSGTTANSVYFHDSDTLPPAKPPEGYTVILTRAAWKGAVNFAKAVDAKIVTSFANSPGVRDTAGNWTPVMARPWLDYTRSIGGSIFAAELFNEPNAPEPPRVLKGHTPDEFARDYAAYSSFMRGGNSGVKLAGPGTAIIGVPGVTAISGITSQDYASTKPAPRFDIFSYHFYPALAQRCAPANSPMGMSADKALSEEWLARPDAEIQRQKQLRDRYAPGAPIWLTETGGAACGGLIWQPTFLDTFRFVDTQARLAKQGLDVMITHALISGSNGIIDEKTLEPNASFWAAVLWRKLLGNRILDAGASPSGMHLYAHCQRGSKTGGVTLIAINLKPEASSLQVPGPAEVYALTAQELQSRSVMLNGRPLALSGHGDVPQMTPARVAGKVVAIAPSSVNFIALPHANNAACKS